MKRATPCINVAIFREAHRVVITASHSFGTDREANLSELSQVNDSIRLDSQLAVEMRSTDEDITTLGDYGRVMAT